MKKDFCVATITVTLVSLAASKEQRRKGVFLAHHYVKVLGKSKFPTKPHKIGCHTKL